MQSTDNVILELTVRNHPGVMTHVCGLFARRAFNVEGILCLPLQNGEQSRIWLQVANDQRLDLRWCMCASIRNRKSIRWCRRARRIQKWWGNKPCRAVITSFLNSPCVTTRA